MPPHSLRGGEGACQATLEASPCVVGVDELEVSPIAVSKSPRGVSDSPQAPKDGVSTAQVALVGVSEVSGEFTVASVLRGELTMKFCS